MLNIRTRIRTNYNPSKRIRSRIRSENIRTIFLPTAPAAAAAATAPRATDTWAIPTNTTPSGRHLPRHFRKNPQINQTIRIVSPRLRLREFAVARHPPPAPPINPPRIGGEPPRGDSLRNPPPAPGSPHPDPSSVIAPDFSSTHSPPRLPESRVLTTGTRRGAGFRQFQRHSRSIALPPRTQSGLGGIFFRLAGCVRAAALLGRQAEGRNRVFRGGGKATRVGGD
jgi:hypothetical protein